MSQAKSFIKQKLNDDYVGSQRKCKTVKEILQKNMFRCVNQIKSEQKD